MTEINETLLRSIIAEVMKEMSVNTNETAAETSEKPVTKPVSNEKAVIRSVGVAKPSQSTDEVVIAVGPAFGEQQVKTMVKNKYKETFRLPFAEQIKFFANKLNLPTDNYLDLEGEEHDYAFVVAGANRNDVLSDFRQAIDKAIIDGTTLDAFRRDFDDIVAKFGWDYNGGRSWRSRIIYDTNLYSSYNAGRYEQHQTSPDDCDRHL